MLASSTMFTEVFAPDNNSLPALLWMTSLSTYHVLAAFVLFSFACQVCLYAIQADSWEEVWGELNRSFKTVKNSVSTECPLSRLRRYRMCAKKCERKRRRREAKRRQSCCGTSTSHGSLSEDNNCPKPCIFEESISRLFKLHLPPPLPYRERRGKLKTRKWPYHYSKQNHDIIGEEEENSESTETTYDTDMMESSQFASEEDLVLDSASSSLTLPPSVSQLPTSTVSLPTPTRTTKLPRTTLIDMARMQQWKTILHHVDRRGAKYRDAEGLYPLHWACSGSPPLDVIQSLVGHYPSATRKTDIEGSTPLHFATHYTASASVIEALVKVYPKAVKMQDKYGRSPLYHAVEKSSGIDVLKTLVQEDPSMITTPCCIRSDLRNYGNIVAHKQSLAGAGAPFETTRREAIRTPLYMVWADVLRDPVARGEFKGKKWEKACILLKAAFEGLATWSLQPKRLSSWNEKTSFSILKAAIVLDLYLPDAIIALALRANPEELFSVGDNSSGGSWSPLMLAASLPYYYSSRRSEQVIQLLLDASPGATEERDYQGRSVLLLAAESGKPWGFTQRLLQVAPDMIYCNDPVTGLPPALLAASANVTRNCSSGCSDKDGHGDLNDTDPFNLLEKKESDLLRYSLVRKSTRRAEMCGDRNAPEISERDPCLEQLRTIYELLHFDPASIKC